MGSFVSTLPDFWDIVRLIRAHRMPLERMITDRLPLADGATKGKVMFVWP
jgi:hypothetical protein